MIKELIEKQKKYLSQFWEELDPSQLLLCLDHFSECGGSLVFCGIGKSGLIAKKIAYTMSSIGAKSLYLCPTDALHGDIGIVSCEDIVVLLSKSGESEELLRLIPFIRSRNALSIGWTSAPNSSLAKAVDCSVSLPLVQELCPFNLVPTSSSLAQLAFGDLLAVALLERKAITLDQYALNHPAGKIGKRLTIRVADLMRNRSCTPMALPTESIEEVIPELSSKRCGAVFIVDGADHLLGIFTDGDLRRTLQKLGAKALSTSVGEVMTPDPRTTEASTLAYHALELMEGDQQHPIAVLPVIDDHRAVVGVLRLHDLLQAGV